MSISEGIDYLRKGDPEGWNAYRRSVPGIPSLAGIVLQGAKLSYVYDIPENIQTMRLPSFEILLGADLSGMDLRNVDLSYADLRRVDFREANLEGARLLGADLAEAKLDGANLRGANLEWSRLVRTSVKGASFAKAHIYGASVWDLEGDPGDQSDLVITPSAAQQLLSPREFTSAPAITVDNLQIAQFVYLLLNNSAIRGVIDTIGKKAVLILGRFTAERKPSLELVRDKLRGAGYLPIVFDFPGPDSRDWSETVVTLAHLSRFIVADLTDPSSVPKELEAIVPTLAIPVQPIIEGQRPYAMFQDYWKYFWVLPPFQYDNAEVLASQFHERVVKPAETSASDLAERRQRATRPG